MLFLDLTAIRQPETAIERVFPPDAFPAEDTFRLVAPAVLSATLHKDEDRFQLRGAWMVLAWATAALLLFPLLAKGLPTILLATVMIGLMGALGPILQSHLMDVAGDARTLAAASHHAAFNTANALGPWLGGMAITAGYGWTSTGYVGAAMAVAGLLLYAWARRSLPSDPPLRVVACDGAP